MQLELLEYKIVVFLWIRIYYSKLSGFSCFLYNFFVVLKSRRISENPIKIIVNEGFKIY